MKFTIYGKLKNVPNHQPVYKFIGVKHVQRSGRASLVTRKGSPEQGVSAHKCTNAPEAILAETKCSTALQILCLWHAQTTPIKKRLTSSFSVISTTLQWNLCIESTGPSIYMANQIFLLWKAVLDATKLNSIYTNALPGVRCSSALVVPGKSAATTSIPCLFYGFAVTASISLAWTWTAGRLKHYGL